MYKIGITHNAVASDQLLRRCGTRSSSDDAIRVAAVAISIFLVRRNGLALRDDAVRISAVTVSIVLVGGGVDDAERSDVKGVHVKL